jgi:hypothetical protein
MHATRTLTAMFGAVLAPYLRIGLVPENAEVATDRRSLYPSRPGGTYPGGDVHDDTGRVDDFVGSRSFSSSSQWRMSRLESVASP